jgi:hypothetical protein
MAGHDHVRPPPPDLVHDLLQAEAAAFRIQQPHLVTGVDERAADHEQPERSLVAHPEDRGDGLVRGVDEEDLHDIRLRPRPGVFPPGEMGSTSGRTVSRPGVVLRRDLSIP